MKLIQLITNTLITAATLTKAEALPSIAVDPYAALTELLTAATPPIDLSRVQAQPESARGRDYLEEDLAAARGSDHARGLAAHLAVRGCLRSSLGSSAGPPY